MKPASTNLTNLLATGSFFMADLYTLTLQGGTVYTWTSADTDITCSGTTWTAAPDNGTQPLPKRGTCRQAKGLEVSTLDVTLNCGQSALIGSAKIPLFAANGGFDGARLLIQRAFMATWGDASAGLMTLFEGLVAGVDPGATQVVLHLKADTERLESMNMPRTLFSTVCNNMFGDSGCGLSLASLAVTCSCISADTMATLNGASGKADNYYANGYVIFTSGANAGACRSISSYVGGVITLALALPSAPAVGDTYKALPGCSRTRSGCSGWSNLANFRGYPFVPVAETAY